MNIIDKIEEPAYLTRFFNISLISLLGWDSKPQEYCRALKKFNPPYIYPKVNGHDVVYNYMVILSELI